MNDETRSLVKERLQLFRSANEALNQEGDIATFQVLCSSVQEARTKEGAYETLNEAIRDRVRCRSHAFTHDRSSGRVLLETILLLIVAEPFDGSLLKLVGQIPSCTSDAIKI